MVPNNGPIGGEPGREVRGCLGWSKKHTGAVGHFVTHVVVTSLLQVLYCDADVIEDALHPGTPGRELGGGHLECSHTFIMLILDVGDRKVLLVPVEVGVTVDVAGLDGREVLRQGGDDGRICGNGLQAGDAMIERRGGGEARSLQGIKSKVDGGGAVSENLLQTGKAAARVLVLLTESTRELSELVEQELGVRFHGAGECWNLEASVVVVGRGDGFQDEK